MIQQAIEILQILLPYGFDLFVILVVLFNRQKLIFTPLAGGNGLVQMDELAKGIIMVVFYLSARAEAFRDHEYHVFSDAYWYALLGCIALIAGIKSGVFSKLTHHKEPKDEPKA